LRRYRDFCDFPDGGSRHLEFSKIRNYNGLSAVGGQYASCQISSKLVKRLQRYDDLTVLKMAAVRHLGFVKFEFFLTVGAVKRPILHQHTKFRKDRLNRCGYIAIFVIFKMAAAAIFNFQKFEILTACPLYEANVRHRAKFHQNRPYGCRDMAI